MVKADVTDMLILALISGVTAILTSVMGISGTVIGAVVSSLAAEMLKTYIKEPVKDKIAEYDASSTETTYYDTDSSYTDYNINKKYQYTKETHDDSSHISTRLLFLFPLVVILIIELIHFLGTINIIPNTVVYNLESLTNWTLFRTIGYALIVMGLYPLVSKKLSTHHGIILIIVGIIELIIGYADTSTQASMLFSVFSSLKEYVNILIILAILYTALTVPNEIKEKNNYREFRHAPINNNFKNEFHNNTKKFHNKKFNNKTNYKSRRNYKNRNFKDEDEDYFYYYEEE